MEWLTLCTRLRASGMPLTAIRRYADLVRAGTGDEEDRLALLRRHQEHVTAQIGELTACLDVISFKVKLYEDRVAQDAAGPLWSPPAWSANDEQELAPG
jgi:DNA-binding transcriptional MerR regulator